MLPRSLGVAGDEAVELDLGLRMGGGCIEAWNMASLHHVATIDEHVADITPGAADEQGLNCYSLIGCFHMARAVKRSGRILEAAQASRTESSARKHQPAHV